MEVEKSRYISKAGVERQKDIWYNQHNKTDFGGSMGKSFIVGIAGGSGSGKSTFVNGLRQVLGGDCTVIEHDAYYRARNDLTYEERCKINYDEPDAFDNELFVEHLMMLRDGSEVLSPVYDYTIHNRSKETKLIKPSKIILLDGLLLFHDERVAKACDLKIFIDTDADTRILRRALRDIKERGRTLESVTAQYFDTVKPMYEKYIDPTKKKADVIIPNGGMNPMAVEMVTTFLKKLI